MSVAARIQQRGGGVAKKTQPALAWERARTATQLREDVETIAPTPRTVACERARTAAALREAEQRRVGNERREQLRGAQFGKSELDQTAAETSAATGTILTTPQAVACEQAPTATQLREAEQLRAAEQFSEQFRVTELWKSELDQSDGATSASTGKTVSSPRTATTSPRSATMPGLGSPRTVPTPAPSGSDACPLGEDDGIASPRCEFTGDSNEADALPTAVMTPSPVTPKRLSKSDAAAYATAVMTPRKQSINSAATAAMTGTPTRPSERSAATSERATMPLELAKALEIGSPANVQDEYVGGIVAARIRQLVAQGSGNNSRNDERMKQCSDQCARGALRRRASIEAVGTRAHKKAPVLNRQVVTEMDQFPEEEKMQIPAGIDNGETLVEQHAQQLLEEAQQLQLIDAAVIDNETQLHDLVMQHDLVAQQLLEVAQRMEEAQRTEEAQRMKAAQRMEEALRVQQLLEEAQQLQLIDAAVIPNVAPLHDLVVQHDLVTQQLLEVAQRMEDAQRMEEAQPMEEAQRMEEAAQCEEVRQRDRMHGGGDAGSGGGGECLFA